MLDTTILKLEIRLVEAVSIWTADILLKSPIDRGAVPVPPTVYQTAIPSYQAGPQAPEQPKAPSIAIRASSASYKRESGEATVHFAILTWDNGLNRLGSQDVANIMERIRQGLQENRDSASVPFPLLDQAIELEIIDDPSEDFHGYYLGALTARFGIISLDPNDAPYDETGDDTLVIGGVPP
jgi:hypothetical protein